jgi:molybdopterin converting factor small subunit
MNVSVRSVGMVRQLLGHAELAVAVPEGTTVTGLLRVLAEEKSEKMAPFAIEPTGPSGHAPLRVMVNGRDILALGGRHTVLEEGDDVLIFVPIAGG